MRPKCTRKLTATKNLGFLPRAIALHMVMASAAAVASSRSEALDMAMPVRSDTMVWKFNSDSSLQLKHNHRPFEYLYKAIQVTNKGVSDNIIGAVRQRSVHGH